MDSPFRNHKIKKRPVKYRPFKNWGYSGYNLVYFFFAGTFRGLSIPFVLGNKRILRVTSTTDNNSMNSIIDLGLCQFRYTSYC